MDGSPSIGGIEGANGGAIVAAEGMTNGTQPSIYVAVNPNTTANSLSATATIVFIGVDDAGSGVKVGEGQVTLNAGEENGTLTTNDVGVLGSNPFINSPYTVVNGVFSTSSLSGSISADGDLIVASDITNGENRGITIFVIQGSGVTTATFRGVYRIAEYGANENGANSLTNIEAALVTIYADGNGNFTYTETTNAAGTVTTGSGGGTYSVTSNGTLTLTPTGSQSFVGAISADGNVLVLADIGAGDRPEGFVGVRQ